MKPCPSLSRSWSWLTVAKLKESCLEPSSDKKLLIRECILEASKFTVGSSHHYWQLSSLQLSAQADPGCTGAHVPLTLVTWLHHGNTIWACALLWQNGKSDTPTRKMRCTHSRLNRCPDNTKLACHTHACSKWSGFILKPRWAVKAVLSLPWKAEKGLTIGYFFTQLVQAYLKVSMDVWGLDR